MKNLAKGMGTNSKVMGCNKLKNQSGVVLLESLIAVLIFSLGILALVGLQAAMVTNTTASKYRADASYVAQQTLGMLWADPAHLGDYLVADSPVPALPNGKLTVTRPAIDQVRVVISWQLPSETEVHNVTMNASIQENTDI